MKEMEKLAYRNFHLDGCDTPKKRWDKLVSLFGKVNEFKALQLETELSSLIPDEHGSIEDYLAKFRSLVAQLKGCRKTKSDNECIFLILSKLKSPYQLFFFHSILPWMHLVISSICLLLKYFVNV